MEHSPGPSICSPSVGLCVCLSVRKVYCGKTAEWIWMPFRVMRGVGWVMGVLDRVVVVEGQGGVLGGEFGASHWNQWGHCWIVVHERRAVLKLLWGHVISCVCSCTTSTSDKHHRSYQTVSPASAASGRYQLRSTGSAVYALPRTRTRFGKRGFFYSGPAAQTPFWPSRHYWHQYIYKTTQECPFYRAYHWLYTVGIPGRVV